MAESVNDKDLKEHCDNIHGHEYKIPTKCVKSIQDVSVWEKSDAYQVITLKPSWIKLGYFENISNLYGYS